VSRTKHTAEHVTVSAEPVDMDTSSISGSDPTGQAYSVRTMKIAQDAAKAEGEGAVALIENSMPPVGANGQGARINTYA
jgi:hypothetical protein